MKSNKQVLSCTQPTGNLHLGRYFGAVRNWVLLQEKYHCTYGIVDLHAMTMPYQHKKLRAHTWDLAFDLIAAGVDPDLLFIQSLIPEHTELAWIFSCTTAFGELSRMTQFKDKSQRIQDTQKDEFVSSGLFLYPVLQAADILIYRADYVPVGKDQEQHLELTRNIAQRFNHKYGVDFFTLPEPLFAEIPKVMSTADPMRKMSASLGDKHNIDIYASPERIRKQIRSAVTDTGLEQSGEMSPGIANLFRLLKASGGDDAHQVLLKKYQGGNLQYAELKDVVADAIITLTEPMRQKRREIVADKRNYKMRIKASTERIRKTAQQTVRDVKEITGLMNVR